MKTLGITESSFVRAPDMDKGGKYGRELRGLLSEPNVKQSFNLGTLHHHGS